MKKKLRGFIAGIVCCSLLTGISVFSKQANETINVIYDNIKLLIDGKEFQPTDALGNIVEPFIYNGTTYLPVRAVASAFDKEVEWEAQTSTVVLGSKNYDWLDQMGYADYETTGSINRFSAIAEDTTMTDKMKYDRGLRFRLYDGSNGSTENNDSTYECYQTISYLLNGQYKNFEGMIAALADNYDDGTAQFKFYGDGSLLYSSPVVSKGTKSTKFSVDVSNVKLLKIKVEYINPSYTGDEIYACIADARLAR